MGGWEFKKMGGRDDIMMGARDFGSIGLNHDRMIGVMVG